MKQQRKEKRFINESPNEDLLLLKQTCLDLSSISYTLLFTLYILKEKMVGVLETSCWEDNYYWHIGLIQISPSDFFLHTFNID